jgi:hypothetical protein
MSDRLCASARGALLQGEKAVAAFVGRATRSEDHDGMSSRIPTDQDLALVVTTHRVLVFKKGCAGRVGQPLFGVGPHNLRRIDVGRHGALNGRVTFAFLDRSSTMVDLAGARPVGKVKAAVERLMPVAA